VIELYLIPGQARINRQGTIRPVLADVGRHAAKPGYPIEIRFRRAQAFRYGRAAYAIAFVRPEILDRAVDLKRREN
jgi:hypothetical protein